MMMLNKTNPYFSEHSHRNPFADLKKNRANSFFVNKENEAKKNKIRQN
jgi:hypothetical protein